MKRIGLITVLMMAVAASVSAAPIGFDCITNNSGVNAAIGEDQLSVEVSEVGGQVVFLFKNQGDQDAVIKAIAFDDATPALLSVSSASITGAGVKFKYDGKYNLPGGNQPAIGFVADYAYGAVPPPPKNGVGVNEQISVAFNYAAGSDFDKVVSAINSGDLRIGLHVISFANGGSESFVNRTTSVPEPGSLSLLALGLVSMAGFGVARRRK